MPAFPAVTFWAGPVYSGMLGMFCLPTCGVCPPCLLACCACPVCQVACQACCPVGPGWMLTPVPITCSCISALAAPCSWPQQILRVESMINNSPCTIFNQGKTRNQMLFGALSQHTRRPSAEALASLLEFTRWAELGSTRNGAGERLVWDQPAVGNHAVAKPSKRNTRRHPCQVAPLCIQLMLPPFPWRAARRMLSTSTQQHAPPSPRPPQCRQSAADPPLPAPSARQLQQSCLSWQRRRQSWQRSGCWQQRRGWPPWLPPQRRAAAAGPCVAHGCRQRWLLSWRGWRRQHHCGRCRSVLLPCAARLGNAASGHACWSSWRLLHSRWRQRRGRRRAQSRGQLQSARVSG